MMDAERCSHKSEHPHCDKRTCPWMVCARCLQARMVKDTTLHGAE